MTNEVVLVGIQSHIRGINTEAIVISGHWSSSSSHRILGFKCELYLAKV